MNISEILKCIPDNYPNELAKILLDKEVSAFILYLVRHLNCDKEEDVKFFQFCESGNIESIREALNQLGNTLGFDTQVLWVKESYSSHDY